MLICTLYDKRNNCDTFFKIKILLLPHANFLLSGDCNLYKVLTGNRIQR